MLYLTRHRPVEALSAAFIVQSYVDGHTLTATAETARDAFAKAVEWSVVGRLPDVGINDGTRCYSVSEFSSVMAFAEIAKTLAFDIK